MSINEIADYLCDNLTEAGLVVQRYDAYSTNSIYLKLDYGVCNSIRISDHPGKRHLKYRYNIGPFVEKYRCEKDKYDRYYYRADKARNLLKKIVSAREFMIARYGEEAYKRFMLKNLEYHKNGKGFWKNAWLVSAGKEI